MRKFVIFCAVVIGIISSVTLSSFYLMKCYSWFLMPVFKFLPDISYSEAIGIATFLAVLKYKYKPKNDTDVEETIKIAIGSVISSFILFALCYAIHLIIR